MGKTFVLRDAAGRLGGYLMIGGGRLRCRIDGRAGEGKLTVIDEDGAEAAFALPGSGKEGDWAYERETAAMAYVCMEDALLLDTGQAARRAYARRADRAAKGHTLRQRSGPAQAALPEMTAETAADQTEQPRYAQPERRWPPPALYAAPVYRAGRWLEDGED